MSTPATQTTAMRNPFVEAIAQLAAAQIEEWSVDQIAAALETPDDLSLGDYALPCFPLARLRRQAPPRIAADIAERLAAPAREIELVKEVVAAGGYVNFRVDAPRFAAYVLGEIQREQDRYGASDEGRGKTIVVDFSSPNIAKMFHVGHLRSTVLGAALIRVFSHLGYETVGINHLGDWGTQFGKLVVAWRDWGEPERLAASPVSCLHELYVRFHQEAERRPELEDEARTAFRELEAGEPETRALWQKFRDCSLEEFGRIYDLLGVEFDSVAGESFYEDKMQSVLDRLDEAGLATTSQDALVVDLSDQDLPPLMLKKQDEATLYATRDLAAAIYRHDTYRFDKLLYVVGQAQELHFRQLFEVLKRMEFPWADDCEHIMFGWVKFGDQHLSTREGNVVLLDEVLHRAVELVGRIIEEKSPDLEARGATARTVGVGAVIFADLATRRIKDIHFDWDEVLSFDHGSGPYVMYTHARLCSILRKYGAAPPDDIEYGRLEDEGERLVIQQLERFPQQLRVVAERREPSYLCSYLVTLSSTVNTYLQKGARDAGLRVLAEDAALAAARVALVAATRQVIEVGLNLLGMGAPERM